MKKINKLWKLIFFQLLLIEIFINKRNEIINFEIIEEKKRNFQVLATLVESAIIEEGKKYSLIWIFLRSRNMHLCALINFANTYSTFALNYFIIIIQN